MLKIPFATWIANAAAGLTGIYGDVTRQAEVADCSRQTIYDHAQKVQAAVEDAHDGGPTRAALIERNQLLRRENAQLWDWLALTIEFPLSQQREFAVTATAMGLSLNQVRVLLALILGTRACPGRSTMHRWVKAAALAAGRVLKSLDERCRALVLVGCLDEIFFHGRPVLVGVEPASMAWFLGQKANDRSGATWAKALRDWPALSFVTADAGTGLQAGIAAVQQERQEEGQPSLENGLDVFHTTYEARRVLRLSWNRVERTLGAGGDRRSPRRTVATARPGCSGCGGRVASCLEEGRGRVRPVRALRSGLEDGPRGARGASSRRSLERPGLGGTTDRPGAAAVVGSRMVQGEELPPDPGDVDVPGPSAPSVARSGPRGFVAYGVGAIVVAASPAAPSEQPWSGCGCGPCGASGATGGLPEGGRELAEVVRRLWRACCV